MTTIETNVADTILQQLGGSRFLAMTGAHSLCNWDNKALSFRLPRAKDRINHVMVHLEGDDTYTVTFSRFAKLELREVEQFETVHAEELRGIFTYATGLHTSL